MPSLVIVSNVEGYRLFEITKDKVVIGRGDDADLVLPNISVSRHHAEVVLQGSQASIQDLESSNGTRVNGKQTQAAVLNSGDEIYVGKFQLIYIGDGPDDRFYKGRYLEYMAKYDPSPSRGGDDATFSISASQLRRQQAESHRMRSAKWVLNKNPSKYWYPEDKGLTMGDGGMIPVGGLFTGGVVAEISWNGRTHVLNKRARLLKILVNEQPKSEHELSPGDRVRIGDTGFRYELPPLME